MNNDGSNVTQVADAGFNPTWSPDGNELALNDDNISNYESRSTYPSASKLWVVNVTTRARRVITTRDAVQSKMSIHTSLTPTGPAPSKHRKVWQASRRRVLSPGTGRLTARCWSVGNR